MGRPLRRPEPGQIHLVTTRCHQARFFLRPDDDLNRTLLEWLARAQKRYPELRILAVCAMSNHLHLVVRDGSGDLANWAAYFLGHLARAVNRIRGRSGACFARRYSAEVILDDGALVDRLAYVVANPVQAGLCKTARDWPGVLLVADRGRPLEIEVEWIDRDAYRAECTRARNRGERPPSPRAFQRAERLVVDPPGGSQGDLRDAISAREQQIARDRRQTRSGFLTRKQVLRQRWQDAPKAPKRGPRPLCHASDPQLRRTYLAGFRAFVASFRRASERLRRGEVGVSFPDWCYPPGAGLVRPLAAPT